MLLLCHHSMFDLAVLPLMPSLIQTQSGFAPLAGIEEEDVFLCQYFFEHLTKRPGRLTTFPHLCCIQLLSNYTLNRQDEMIFH